MDYFCRQFLEVEFSKQSDKSTFEPLVLTLWYKKTKCFVLRFIIGACVFHDRDKFMFLVPNNKYLIWVQVLSFA